MKKTPLTKIFALFLGLALLTTAGVSFYLIYLLNQEAVDVKKVRITAGSTAGGILALIVLLIIAFIFVGSAFARSLASKSGLFSIFMILCLGVIMGLFFAILPKVKDTSSPEDLQRAKTFAIIASLFGTLLFVIVLLRYAIKYAKVRKEKKGIEETIDSLIEKEE